LLTLLVWAQASWVDKRRRPAAAAALRTSERTLLFCDDPVGKKNIEDPGRFLRLRGGKDRACRCDRAKAVMAGYGPTLRCMVGRAPSLGRAGLAWPLMADLTDDELECRLYPPPTVAARDRRPLPDWVAVHRELRRPGPLRARVV
jgi:hypothetical protein